MALTDQIKTIYPDITDVDFNPTSGIIHLQNDGNEDYIKLWNHPTHLQPTQEQLLATGK